MVEADPVLVEAIVLDRAVRKGMGPDAEAHAAVAQERARVQVHELREAEDLRVELHGPIDVADGESEMVNTLRGDLVGHAGLLRRPASTLRRPTATSRTPAGCSTPCSSA